MPCVNMKVIETLRTEATHMIHLQQEAHAQEIASLHAGLSDML